MTAQAIVYGIGLVLSALSAGPGVIARWRVWRGIVSEGRAPTSEEFAALDAEIDQNARERDEILAGKLD